MAKFTQRIPGGVDPSLQPLVIEFDVQEELIDSDYVQGFTTMKGHVGFVMSDGMLMAISDEGYHWWVLGYIDEPDIMDLPPWEGAKYRGMEVVEEEDEDLEEARKNFNPEDLSGGLHNVQVPQDFIDEQDEKTRLVRSFIDLNAGVEDIAYKVDGVKVTFTPEELVILTEILEQHSIQMTNIEYMQEEMKTESLFEQQKMVRHLRHKVYDTLARYVRVRPYTPFNIPWLKRIGLYKRLKGKDE
jgi:hypothetical protein